MDLKQKNTTSVIELQRDRCACALRMHWLSHGTTASRLTLFFLFCFLISVMQVVAVFILYVRCAGCDPADPGVHQSKRAARAKQLAMLKSMNFSIDESERTSVSRKTPRLEAASSPSIYARWFCVPSACCYNKNDSSKLNEGEQLLYCSICEAAVRHMFCLWWTNYVVFNFLDSGVVLLCLRWRILPWIVSCKCVSLFEIFEFTWQSLRSPLG